MATTHVVSDRSAEMVTEAILALCPGDPVGAVLSREGRLLLPRRVSFDQVVVERRKPGMPPGRILIGLAPTGSGTLVSITSSGEPLALVISGVLVASLVVAAGWFGGVVVGGGVGAVLAAVEWVQLAQGVDRPGHGRRVAGGTDPTDLNGHHRRRRRTTGCNRRGPRRLGTAAPAVDPGCCPDHEGTRPA